MVRAPCCEKMGVKKGSWTPEEDQILISYIQRYGHGNWRALPKHAGLLRCGKSCRLRWTNYLRPDIKRGNFSKEEEDIIMRLHRVLGNRWSAIAAKLPGRTDNEIKNFWHSHLKKNLKQNPAIPATPCTLNTDNIQNYGYGPIFCRQSQKLLALHPSIMATMHPIGAEGKGTTSCSFLSSKYELLVDHQGLPSTKETINNKNTKNIKNDEMGFWYNLFIEAGKFE